jgi:ABC-2 type transport system permease protein
MTVGFSFRRFRSLWIARNKEFLRDRGALGWNLLFPILVILGFGYGFGNGEQEFFKVAVLGEPDPAVIGEFKATRHIRWLSHPAADEAPVLARLRRHQVDLVLAPPARYWVNEGSPKGYLAEKLLLASLRAPSQAQSSPGAVLEKKTVFGREIRYVDWLVSGLLGMNLMFSALFGVGYVIVRYRKSGVLRRLKATPVTPLEFLLAQVVSRMALLAVSTALVYAGCHFAVDLQMHGSYLDLFIVLMLGSFCMISIGLLVAARIRSEEFAGGVLNLLTWPMIFLSGVWFSLEGSPLWVQRVASVFPLTHVIHASRSIMTEGATLAQLSGSLWALLGLSLVFLAIGSRIFRWE